MSKTSTKDIEEGVALEEIAVPEYDRAYADYFEHDTRASASGIRTKVARWDRLFSGDCGEEPGATLTLRSDGSANFECVTFTNTSHSGDHWWAAFLLQDKDNVTLHSEPWHKGPEMNDGHPPPRYRWGFDFRFDGGKFDAITKVLYAHKC